MQRKRDTKKALVAVLLFSLILTVSSPLVSTASAIQPEAPTSVLMDANRNKIFDALETIMSGRTDNLPINVIVTFRTTPSESLMGTLRDAVGSFVLKSQWTVVPGIAASLTPSQIRTMALMGDVVQIEYDAPVQVFLNTATYWYGVQAARTDFGADGDRDGSPATYTKDDIVIALIDTGIDPNHMDLDGGKIIGWKDFVNARTSPYDDHGHGTHCSSIAAGTGEGNSAYKGVATGAALVGVKVLNSQGSGTITAIVDGVNWVVNNKALYGIEIISMSLGSTGSSDGTDSLSQACNNAVNQGVAVAVAAGNSGPAKKTIGSPAAAENVITVGSLADVGQGGFFLSYFSSRGPTADGRIKPDICTPGHQITAAKAGTTNGYVEYSGTSMATPFAAGVAALMLDVNPALTPAQVKSMMASSSVDWGPVGKDVDYGYGRLDAYLAVKTAGGFAYGTGPTTPSHYYKSEDLLTTGSYDLWTITVTSTNYPVAITLIMPNWRTIFFFWSTPDFDMYLSNPSGTQIASAEGATRQETTTVTISTTGTYTLKVYSYSGSGSYFFDVSAGASGVYLSYDG